LKTTRGISRKTTNSRTTRIRIRSTILINNTILRVIIIRNISSIVLITKTSGKLEKREREEGEKKE
jgi:hypothetical protein